MYTHKNCNTYILKNKTYIAINNNVYIYIISERWLTPCHAHNVILLFTEK